MPKSIKRLEDGEKKGRIGEPVKIDRDIPDWRVQEEIDKENEEEKDLDKPRLNFSCRPSDPPRTEYDDFGDSVQKKILGK